MVLRQFSLIVIIVDLMVDILILERLNYMYLG